MVTSLQTASCVIQRYIQRIVWIRTLSGRFVRGAFKPTMGFHKSTLVARGANIQLDSGCVSAPPATNVDLFACFAERLFKSSSISYLLSRRVASDSLYVGMTYAWSLDRTACRMFNRQNSQNNAILALN